MELVKAFLIKQQFQLKLLGIRGLAGLCEQWSVSRLPVEMCSALYGISPDRMLLPVVACVCLEVLA